MSVFIFKTLFSLCEILFYIQSIILNSKGWCSWLLQSMKLERFGSEPRYLLWQTRNISKYFTESKYSKSKWNRALRVAVCRGLQEMDVRLSLRELKSERGALGTTLFNYGYYVNGHKCITILLTRTLV